MIKFRILFFLPLLLFNSCKNKINSPNPSSSIPETYVVEIHGHRGDRGNFPENSIPAFLSALDKGVDALEFDVVISRDKKVVVSHEPFMAHAIMLKPSGEGILKNEELALNLYQMCYDSIRSYLAGVKYQSDFPIQKKTDTYKPLLSEVIDTVENYIQKHQLASVKYNIEIKSKPRLYDTHQPHPDEFSDLVMQVLQEKGVVDRLYIQSFDSKVLNAMNCAYPEVELCYLVSGASVEDNLDKLNFIPDIYSPPGKFIPDTEAANKIKQLGMKLIAWSANEPQEMTRVMKLGVMAVISDYPEQALEVREAYYKYLND